MERFELGKFIRPLNNEDKFYTCDKCNEKAPEIYIPVGTKLFLCQNCFLKILKSLEKEDNKKINIDWINRNLRKIIYFSVMAIVLFIVIKTFF